MFSKRKKIKATGSFLTSQWDPILIVGQIVCMQCLFYVVFGCVILVLDSASKTPLTLSQLLQPSSSSPSSQVELWWIPVLSLFVTAFFCSIGLVFVVEKARKCLDFSVTAFLFHMIFSFAYGGFPLGNPAWWGTVIGSCILMAVLGEFLCMKRELREIPVGIASQHTTRSILSV